jgi:hypothetical protein
VRFSLYSAHATESLEASSPCILDLNTMLIYILCLVSTTMKKS